MAMKKTKKKAPKAKKKGAKKHKAAKKVRGTAARSTVKRGPAFKNLNLREIIAVISKRLAKSGHDPVLVGQACAALYVGNSIRPQSCEFALKDYEVNSVGEAMEKLGFCATGRHAFSSERCPFEVVLTALPITIGDYVVGEIRSIKTPHGEVKTLTPTDCVRNRLFAFYRFGDKDALHDAAKVARRNKIDLDLIRRWSDWEWAGDKYDEFLKEMSEKS